MKSAEEQLELLEQGTEIIHTREELKQKLEQNRPLRVKLGADPTAPDLHLGHGVVLQKLRQFQDLGHKAVLIIGDYTALVGDPSGQNKTRPMLNAEQIDRNAKTYFEQAGKILDTSPDKLEIRPNSEWLGKMTFADVLRLASRMTVARMLERDTFELRFEADVPIGVHEFLYPLMQGHDSVMIRADVELGGTDQLFNNLVGRDLQRDAGQEPQVVMILPILEGLDGIEKMSKSKGNYIGLNDSPEQMFLKVMSINDATMWRWWHVLFGFSQAQVVTNLLMTGRRRLSARDLADETLSKNPRYAKELLALYLVEQYHGSDAAAKAAETFDRRVVRKEVTAVRVWQDPECQVPVLDLLLKLWADFKSRGDIRRLIRDGGVEVDGHRVEDENLKVLVHDNMTVRAGKKRPLVRITVRSRVEPSREGEAPAEPQ